MIAGTYAAEVPASSMAVSKEIAMMVLNEVTSAGVRRLELWPDDVACVSSVPTVPGTSEIDTIDGRRFRVAEGVSEVFARLEASDGEWGEMA
jgi:hypothetical protein